MRKDRVVKNSLVDLDDVSIPPGIEYQNWTPLVKTKIKKREMQLMARRMIAFREILNSSIQQFSLQNRRYFVEQRGKTTIRVDRMERANLRMSNEWFDDDKLRRVLSECGQQIDITLRNWRGVRNSQKIRECTVSFRTYFNIAKNWFDQIKSNEMTIHFWIPILSSIDHFTRGAAALFFCDRFPDLQRLYSRYLRLLVLRHLVIGRVRVPNTKAVLLVSAGCYAKSRLKGKRWLFQEFVTESARKMNSTELRRQTLDRIEKQLVESRQRFQESLYRLHDEVDNYSVYTVPAVSTVSTVSSVEPKLETESTVQIDIPPVHDHVDPELTSPPIGHLLFPFGAPRDWNGMSSSPSAQFVRP